MLLATADEIRLLSKSHVSYFVSPSHPPGPMDVLKRSAGLGLAATAFDLQLAVAAIEALCDHGEGCAGPLKRPSVQTRQSQAGSLRLMGGFLRAPGVSAGVQRSERRVSIDNIARIVRGLKVNAFIFSGP
jgi:hypothetical protein